MKKFLFIAVAAAVVLLAVNFYRVYQPAQESSKYREGVGVFGYYQYGVNPKSIVLDLRDVSGQTSAIDVLAVVLNFSEVMKDRSFDKVVLAYKGKQKFIIPGNDFKEIGESRSYQNPAYLARTFPEKLETMNGTKAYPTWTGGMIGVLGKQMEDLNQFADAWFRDEAIRSF